MARKAAKHNPGALERLDDQERKRLVMENLAEVGYIARRIHSRIPEHIELEDLMEELRDPLADEVTLGELEMEPGHRFLYLFDYGDELRHDVEVVGTFPIRSKRGLPRVAEAHGEPPPK